MRASRKSHIHPPKNWTRGEREYWNANCSEDANEEPWWHRGHINSPCATVFAIISLMNMRNGSAPLTCTADLRSWRVHSIARPIIWPGSLYHNIRWLRNALYFQQRWFHCFPSISSVIALSLKGLEMTTILLLLLLSHLTGYWHHETGCVELELKIAGCWLLSLLG